MRSYVCVQWLAEFPLQGCAQQTVFSCFIITAVWLILSDALDQPVPPHIQALSSTALRPILSCSLSCFVATVSQGYTSQPPLQLVFWALGYGQK